MKFAEAIREPDATVFPPVRGLIGVIFRVRRLRKLKLINVLCSEGPRLPSGRNRGGPVALHLPLTRPHEPTALPVSQAQFVTTGVPPSARVSTPTSTSDMSTPSVGVLVLATGGPEALSELLAALMPACRECAAELVVVRRGLPIGLPQVDEAGVHVVFGKPGETEGELRARGMAEMESDITVITSDNEPLSRDWSTLLARLGQVVQQREDEVVPAEWVTRLRDAGAPDPAG